MQCVPKINYEWHEIFYTYYVTRRGSKKAHVGNTVAKILIEENGDKKIEIDWSELSADDEADIIRVIEKNCDYINECIPLAFNINPQSNNLTS